MTVQRSLRALIALDPAEPSDDAVELLASLSGGNPVELLGLFVEDINVHRLADLPFASEVHTPSATQRGLDRQRIARQFRTQATTIRNRFESTALRLKMQHSFRVERGEIVAEVRRAALDTDVLIVGRGSRRRSSRSFQGKTIHTLAADTSRTVVFAHGQWRLGRSVLVVYDGSDAARSLLATGVQLAVQEGVGLIVLIEDGPQADDLGAEASSVLREADTDARFLRLATPDARTLARTAAEESSRLLLMPADHPAANSEGIRELLERSPCCLVLGRQAGTDRGSEVETD